MMAWGDEEWCEVMEEWQVEYRGQVEDFALGIGRFADDPVRDVIMQLAPGGPIDPFETEGRS